MTDLNGYTFARSSSQTKRDRLLALLKAGGTAAQLGANLGLQKNAVLRYIEAARRDGVKIRVSVWSPNSPGSPSPVYKLGARPDASKPAPVPLVERKRRHRAKDGVAEAEAMAKRAKRLKPWRDPMTAALFGAA